MPTSLERLEALENDVQQIKEFLSTFDPNNNPLVQMVAEKSVGIEQSMISISKTLAAITEELIETKVLKSEGVMVRMRDAQDGEQVNQIKSLKEAKMLEPATEIGEASIVVVKQQLVDTKTGDVKVLSNYRIVSMSHPTTNQVIRSNLLGKTVKGTVEGNVDADRKDIITVKEIYNLKETEVQGEQPEAQAEQTEEAQAEDGVSFDQSNEAHTPE